MWCVRAAVKSVRDVWGCISVMQLWPSVRFPCLVGPLSHTYSA